MAYHTLRHSLPERVVMLWCHLLSAFSQFLSAHEVWSTELRQKSSPWNMHQTESNPITVTGSQQECTPGLSCQPRPLKCQRHSCENHSANHALRHKEKGCWQPKQTNAPNHAPLPARDSDIVSKGGIISPLILPVPFDLLSHSRHGFVITYFLIPSLYLLIRNWALGWHLCIGPSQNGDGDLWGH